MKNTLHILILSLGIILCSITLPSCEQEPIQRETPKITLSKKSAEIVKADQAFGFELFREVYAYSEVDNIMISPMSVSYALGMTMNGAAGTTRDSFDSVLHFEGLSSDEINESYFDLMRQLLNLSDEVDFALANSLWYRENYPVLESFVQSCQQYFMAEVAEADFTDPATVELINDWIEKQTRGKIRNMLDRIPPDAVMYLVNAIYFNAKWRYEFPKEDTYSGDFHLEETGTLRVDYMVAEGDFAYTGQEDFTAVELPYSDSSFSMLVMLPGIQTGIDGLVDRLDVNQWESWFEGTQRRPVRIELPRFKYAFKDLLNDPLKKLGLEIAFSDFADFSNMVDGRPVAISRVIHQSFIDVQEEGTEAAAATIVEMKELSAIPGVGSVLFRVDRPFLYLIRENSTGAIVFMGKVGRPEYS